MIIPIKNKDGEFVAWRPPFIGFVKNNYLRRGLMILFLPYTVMMTIAVNLVVVAIASAQMLVKAVYKPIYSAFFAPWALWDRPRVKGRKI